MACLNDRIGAHDTAHIDLVNVWYRIHKVKNLLHGVRRFHSARGARRNHSISSCCDSTMHALIIGDGLNGNGSRHTLQVDWF